MEERGIPCLWQGGFTDPFPPKTSSLARKTRSLISTLISLSSDLGYACPDFPCGSRILLLLRYRGSLSFSDYYCPLLPGYSRRFIPLCRSPVFCHW